MTHMQHCIPHVTWVCLQRWPAATKGVAAGCELEMLWAVQEGCYKLSRRYSSNTSASLDGEFQRSSWKPCHGALQTPTCSGPNGCGSVSSAVYRGSAIGSLHESVQLLL